MHPHHTPNLAFIGQPIPLQNPAYPCQPTNQPTKPQQANQPNQPQPKPVFKQKELGK
jgi:hypothetical protein